jgi:uncharacterized protein YciI
MLVAFSLVGVVMAGSAAAAAPRQESKLVKFYLGLLVAGPSRAQSDAEAANIQSAHLAYLESLVKSGKAVVVGPMGDGGRVLGVEVLRAASVEEARQWADADPAVKAGRLVVELSSWFCEDGIIQKAWSTTDLEPLYFGFLVKGPTWSPEKTPESAKTQQAHLGHLEAMWKAGRLLIAGPMGEDGNVRGLVVYRAKDLAEAVAWASADPAVKSGRLAVEMHPWHVARGVFRSRDRGRAGVHPVFRRLVWPLVGRQTFRVRAGR